VVVPPTSVTGTQTEELAGRLPVPVEVDFKRRLLRVRERASKAAGAVQQIVQAGREPRIVRDLGRDLGPDISADGHGFCFTGNSRRSRDQTPKSQRRSSLNQCERSTPSRM
jgi:hypothetical protein